MAREMYNVMAAMLEADAVEIPRIEDISCPGPAGDIALRLYDSQAERNTETSVIIFYHGGGFVIGDLESHHSFCTYIAREMDIPVIAAGGLASVEDIHKLRARKGRPIAGAVLGRALYTGAIKAPEAIKAAA